MSSSIGSSESSLFKQFNSSIESKISKEAQTDKGVIGKVMNEPADNNLSSSSEDDEKGNNEEANKLSLAESFSKVFGNSRSGSILQSRSLEFSVAEYKGQTVVKVIDKESKDVIRQIPSEEFIKVAQRIDTLSDEMQKMRGILLDKQV
ncbi:flagellar protein FlaG [Pseudoalteromonas sp. HL-AS1]|uniref:flagellar protein FlaG n=1 Tax=Pseudoalteromonas sp. HL-AS1 TaxID=3071081 RepID=UPI002815CD18|nr:flagellar protein FlaG [Pseudoalteromonas sp. HL-AS1]WMS89956.1 flagellar protein FlaG [Pseudoalteromonas sp. HL-AS1]